MALVPRIAHQWPEVRVVILSTCCSRAFVTEVLRGGARAYVVKRDCFDDLLEAVRAAAAGSVCLSASARQAIIDEYVERRPDSQTAHDPALTDRERTVLELIAEGRTSKEIGLILDLSSKTIDACRRQLMRKLEVNSVAGLVKCALMMGMTTLTA
jgi:DNA-binding NarL/FixJ family response regulator